MTIQLICEKKRKFTFEIKLFIQQIDAQHCRQLKHDACTT